MKRLGPKYLVEYRERIGSPVVRHVCLVAPPDTIEVWFENASNEDPVWCSWIKNIGATIHIETRCPFCDVVFPQVRELLDLLMNEVVAAAERK